jgi:hypothetical protein
MVDPCLVTSDNAMQIPAETWLQMSIWLCLCCTISCFGTNCTNFMEVNSVVDDFTQRTMTNLQQVCHFIDSHLSFVKNQHPDLFDVHFSC